MKPLPDVLILKYAWAYESESNKYHTVSMNILIGLMGSDNVEILYFRFKKKLDKNVFRSKIKCKDIPIWIQILIFHILIINIKSFIMCMLKLCIQGINRTCHRIKTYLQNDAWYFKTCSTVPLNNAWNFHYDLKWRKSTCSYKLTLSSSRLWIYYLHINANFITVV